MERLFILQILPLHTIYIKQKMEIIQLAGRDSLKASFVLHHYGGISPICNTKELQIVNVLKFIYLFILFHSSNFIRNFLFFSHDVTAAMLVSQNNETAAMLLSQTSPVGDKLFPHALMRFLLFQQICIYVGHVSENTLLMSVIVSQSIAFYKNIHLYRIYTYIDIYSLLDILFF